MSYSSKQIDTIIQKVYWEVPMNPTNEIIFDEKTFGLRLAKLRQMLDISAREMSLDLGQNKNYINSIETGKNYPSMASFLYICKYLNIHPRDFFDFNFNNPKPYDQFESIYRKLTPSQAYHIQQIAQDILNHES